MFLRFQATRFAVKRHPAFICQLRPRMAAAAAYSPGEPTAAVVAPGSCVFGNDWASSPLLSKVSISHDTRVFTFGLPDSKPLGLSTCACILAKGDGCVDAEGKPVIRPYTPVSTNAMMGKFELMVKVYPEGKLSQHLDKMEIGQSMDFKHVDKNVKMQYPFKPAVGMIVGGTGITPMIQALHAVLGTPGDTSKVAMLYGSRTANDILGKETMDAWQGERLSVEHVLSHEPEGSEWAGSRGFIGKELIEKHFPPPGPDVTIFVCGPPPLYVALCGPRDQPELTGILADMGYTADMVYKF